jgi:Fe-S oxidoreductase
MVVRLPQVEVGEADEKEAEIIAVSYPACLVSLKAGAKEAGVKMKVKDIITLLPNLI